MDSKKLGLIAAAIVVIILAYGGYKLMSEREEASEGIETTTQATSVPTAADSMMASGSGMTTDGVKEFTVDGSNFKFEPATLNVNQGDKVKITFKNIGGTHNFVIDELNIETETIQSGAMETVEFTADKAGTFEYYCSVGNHRAMGMKGTLVVN